MSDLQTAISEIEKGNYQEAKASLIALYSKDILNPQINHVLGIVNLRMGLIQEAATSFLTSLSSHPNNPSAAKTLISITKGLGDRDAALAIAEIILDVDPENQEFISIRNGLQNEEQFRQTPFFGPWASNREYLEIHSSVILGHSSSITIPFRPLNKGAKVIVGEYSQIFGSISLQNPSAVIRIGSRTQIGDCKLIACNEINIGNDVIISAGVTIIDNDSHSIYWDERSRDVIQCGYDHMVYPEDPCRNKNWDGVGLSPIFICDKSWVGLGALVLKGVTIGEGAVVDAGSVVTHDVEPWTLVAGNPAKPVKKLSRSRDV